MISTEWNQETQIYEGSLQVRGNAVFPCMSYVR